MGGPWAAHGSPIGGTRAAYGRPMGSPWGNQVRIIGGTRLVWRGTADPLNRNTILYPNCKNPKGKPGWGKIGKTP